MNTALQSQFDRVEIALNTLIDSITSYNPSVTAATVLLAADNDLSHDLEQLSVHQRNHVHLVSLRATTAALDTQIKSALGLLAETRKELLTSTPITPIPPTTSSSPDHALRYTDLLNYASRIARFTVPPTVRRPPPEISGNDEAETATVKAIKLDTRPSTPLPTLAAAPTTPTAQGSTSLSAQVAGAERENKAVSALPDATKVWLDPTASGVPFTPWPGDETIRRGALAQIQATWERGVDPGAEAGLSIEGQGVSETRRVQELEEESKTQVGSTSRRPAQTSTKIVEERREKQDAGGLLGFDLYDPDEE